MRRVLGLLAASLLLTTVTPRPTLAAAGGPDGAGYTWRDVDHGAVYDYEAAANALNLGGDGYSVISIGFDFEFYGTTYSEVTVSADGGLHFDGSQALPTDNQSLQYGSWIMLLPLWDALAPDGGGDVYYETTGTAPDRVLIVEWRDVPHYAALYPYYTTGDASFEIKLFETDDSIEFHYQDVDFGDAAYDQGASATVGTQEGVQGYVFEYSYNTVRVEDEWSIRYEPCPDADGDGHDDDECGGGGCDGGDADVNPMAVDVACDYIDNDCDGVAPPEENDNDHDGYDECAGDCNDHESHVHPGATEVCNGVDEDCVGDVDEGFDADGDGFSSCAGDCDDHDLAAFPGAGEICEDGSDNDSDGLVDEEDIEDCDPGDDDTGDDDTSTDDDTSIGDDDTAATNDCECRVAPGSRSRAVVVLAALGLLAALRRR